MTVQIQTRGNCQCCGRLQAQVRGDIAKHGYTVEDGWFQGVCQGHRYPSMQVERTVTDGIVASVRADVAALEIQLGLVKEGKLFPATVTNGRKFEGNKMVDVIVPYKEAEVWNQVAGVKAMIWKLESRIRSGTQFADGLEGVANRVHGTPLVQVAKPEPAARIQAGEQRLNERGLVLTALYQDAARVYYSYINSAGKLYKGAWIGSRAWRALKTPEKQAENV